MNNGGDMKQSVVLITGVTTGFGKTILDYLSSLGHIVYGTTRDRKKYLSLNGTDREASILEVDLTSDEEVKKAVNQIIEKEGRINVLINNAGFGVIAPIDDTPVKQVKEIFEINFFAVVRMIQAVLPHMRAEKSGLIINIGSLAGQARKREGDRQILLLFLGRRHADPQGSSCLFIVIPIKIVRDL